MRKDRCSFPKTDIVPLFNGRLYLCTCWLYLNFCSNGSASTVFTIHSGPLIFLYIVEIWKKTCYKKSLGDFIYVIGNISSELFVLICLYFQENWPVNIPTFSCCALSAQRCTVKRVHSHKVELPRGYCGRQRIQKRMEKRTRKATLVSVAKLKLKFDV